MIPDQGLPAWIVANSMGLIRPEQIFPVWLMVNYVGAAAVYFAYRDPWRGWYWIFATGLTAVFTFKP
jgi:hypothetical protein